LALRGNAGGCPDVLSRDFPLVRPLPAVSDPIKLSSKATQEFWEIAVLFEDEHLLALNKPARLLTSPDRYDPARPNLMRLLHTGIAEAKPWAKQRGLSYLSNAHRLDFETSGVILLAKSKPVLVKLADQFGADRPRKVYAALVSGTPANTTWEVDAAIGPHPTRLGVMRVDQKQGKQSRTSFSVRESFRRYALLECRPVTGRTHQIRVHLKHSGLPICGDRAYGGKPLWLSRLKPDYRLKEGREERPLISTLALHAEQLTLPHPETGQEIVIAAPWPKDLLVAVRYLQRYAVGSGSSVSQPDDDDQPADPEADSE
jgi:RluA family pseudouridine synthase